MHQCLLLCNYLVTVTRACTALSTCLPIPRQFDLSGSLLGILCLRLGNVVVNHRGRCVDQGPDRPDLAGRREDVPGTAHVDTCEDVGLLYHGVWASDVEYGFGLGLEEDGLDVGSGRDVDLMVADAGMGVASSVDVHHMYLALGLLSKEAFDEMEADEAAATCDKHWLG